MLKGDVFKNQIFENHVFALFIDTFLDGKNGIRNGYKDSMQINYSNNSITISSGVVCIKGRFLEEDTGTTLNIGTDTAFCKLVIEIDLDKENTESEFNQGYYKIVKGVSNYPELIQNDIVNTNSGVYQYELARFKTSLNGIIDFSDQRTYLDFESIYAEIQRKINEIENGSNYVTKGNQYQVGDIYLTMSANNPSERFGGVWERIANGRMLVGVDENDNDFNEAGKTGGEKTHTQTIEEMPKHKHKYSRYNWYNATIDPSAGGSGREPNANLTAVDSGETGGGQPFNIMSPYITCYIWLRIA